MADRWSLVEPGTMGTWLVVTDKPFRHPTRGGVTNIVAWVNREEDAREIVEAHNGDGRAATAASPTPWEAVQAGPAWLVRAADSTWVANFHSRADAEAAAAAVNALVRTAERRDG